jgi:S1-C subfamily serine protease
MKRTQIIFRLFIIAFSLSGLTFGAYAQPVVRPRPAAQVPPGLVYVSQRIDLRQQLGADETIYSLDGEPIPQLQTTSVTLGLLLDGEGYVVTRLANIPASNAPLQLMIYPAGERGGQFRANFIGMDSVTGFCVLKIENLPPTYANFAIGTTTTSSLPQRPIQIWGFNPKQRGGGTPGVMLIKPRLFSSTGLIKKATDDFRYSTGNPIFHLVAPTTLTPVQDCSVAIEKPGTITGLVAYDTTGENLHLVYPLSRLQQLAAMIIEHKRFVVPHAWLGAMSGGHNPYAKIPAPKQLTEAERGVLITRVFPDSPAEFAGVRPNDMLVSISGRTLTTGADLSSTLQLLPADSQVTLKVRRGRELKSFPARLAPAPALDAKQQINWLISKMEEHEYRAKQLPESDPNRAKNESKSKIYESILKGVTNAAPPEIWLRIMYGVEVTALTPQLAKHLAAPGGALITTLNASHKLAQAGAKVGDVVVKIGEQVIADSASLMQALSNEKADPLEILLVRQGQTMTLTVTK